MAQTPYHTNFIEISLIEKESLVEQSFTNHK